MRAPSLLSLALAGLATAAPHALHPIERKGLSLPDAHPDLLDARDIMRTGGGLNTLFNRDLSADVLPRQIGDGEGSGGGVGGGRFFAKAVSDLEVLGEDIRL